MPPKPPDYEALLPYCTSDIQRLVLEAYIKYDTQPEAAAALGRNKRTLERHLAAVKYQAMLRGYAPEYGLNHPVAPSLSVKGTSELYHHEKGKILEWVKTDRDAEVREVHMRELVDALKDELPAYRPIKSPKHKSPELLNHFPIADYHMGMRSWPEETGAVWDMDYAEELLVRWFGLAIARAPKADTAVLALMGDFLHWDGWEAVTPASKHVVDVDTRYQLLVRVANRAVHRIIQALLKTHNRVHVKYTDANHDPGGGAWMRETLDHMYRNEPRLSVDISADTYYAYEFGLNSLFHHHGHRKTAAQVDRVFAGKFPEIFGRTRYRYGHTGHLHNEVTYETPLMLIDQHRTLAAPDAYASKSGYLSGRDAKVDTHHAKYGRVSRLVIGPELVRDHATAGITV